LSSAKPVRRRREILDSVAAEARADHVEIVTDQISADSGAVVRR